MGGSRWDDDDYVARSTSRASLSVDGSAFKYSADVKSGAAPAVAHKTLDPKGLALDGKVRESRDSDAHPNSNAIVVQLDVTGSMGNVVRTIQSKLPALMGLLLRKGYIDDPQILFMAVGDAYSDSIPIQIGQFESGAEMDEDLGNMVLECGGGGSGEESYQIGMFYGARKTSIDCFEKRGRKGYYFIIGDERTYPQATKTEMAMEKCGGVMLEADVPTKQILKELQEKFNVFFVLPLNASNSVGAKKHWQELLGAQNVLELKDENLVSELIATQIGLCEGTTDVDSIKTDLKDAGASAASVALVTSAVSSAYKGGSVTKVAAGALEPTDGPAGVKRL